MKWGRWHAQARTKLNFHVASGEGMTVTSTYDHRIIQSEQLDTVGRALTTIPDTFTLHPKLKQVIEKRRAMVEASDGLDWATAELLAFGTLLLDGFRVRLSG